MAPPEVCVVGEINPDIILYGLPAKLKHERETLMERFRVTLGGSSAIFGHNLSVLGTSVGICSRIGSDAFGEMSLAWLQEAGVDASRVRTESKSSTGITVILASPKRRLILTYPGAMYELRYEDLDLNYIFSARHLHLSSYFLHKALRPRIIELFRTAKEKGLTTSLDTNDDPAGKWSEEVLKLLEFVDIFLPNEQEARKVTHADGLTHALQILSGICKLVVVKLGPRGAIAVENKRKYKSRPVRIVPRDTIGAGDSFDAGYIHRFLEGAPTEEALNFAAVVGAYSATGEGGIEAFRDRKQLRKFIDDQLVDGKAKS